MAKLNKLEILLSSNWNSEEKKILPHFYTNKLFVAVWKQVTTNALLKQNFSPQRAGTCYYKNNSFKECLRQGEEWPPLNNCAKKIVCRKREQSSIGLSVTPNFWEIYGLPIIFFLPFLPSDKTFVLVNPTGSSIIILPHLARLRLI